MFVAHAHSRGKGYVPQVQGKKKTYFCPLQRLLLFISSMVVKHTKGSNVPKIGKEKDIIALETKPCDNGL